MATRNDIPPQFLVHFDALTVQEQTTVLAVLDDRVASAAALSGNVVPTLRGWSDDAEVALASWDAWTTAQRFAALKIVVGRFGIMVDRMADLLVRNGD